MTLKKAYKTLFISILLMLLTIVFYAMGLSKLNLQWGLTGFVVATILSIFAVILSIHESKHPRDVKKGNFIMSHRFEILDWFSFLTVSMMAIFMLFTFFFLPSDVKHSSMMPTLQENQRVLIRHFNYEPEVDDIVIVRIERGSYPTIGNSFFYKQERSCISFTEWITGTCQTVNALDKNGDFILLDEIFFVKRLYAKPGDLVEFVNYGDKDPRDNVQVMRYEIQVNGIVITSPIDEPYYADESQMLRMMMFLENNRLMPGLYFAFGDNANGYMGLPASFDSRGFGAIPEKDIVGKVVYRLWPLGKIS